MKARVWLAAGVLAGAVCLGGILWAWPEAAEPVFGRFPEAVLVIDPGHGGEDGGAVSVSGQVESQVNLSIALQLDGLMGFYGVRTVLTRETDRSIHDDDADTLREKKVSDLHNRAALVNALENATLLSIHQNAGTSRSYHGTQVFYANGDLSRPLAQLTQETLRQALDPGNTRAPQKIPDSVYLMNHVTCRAILVECGFLSNPEEDVLLQSRDYRLRVAMGLGAAYINYETTQERESLI